MLNTIKFRDLIRSTLGALKNLKKAFFLVFSDFYRKFRFFSPFEKGSKKGCFWPKKGHF